MGRFIRWLIILAVVCAACAYGYRQYKNRAAADKPDYLTTPLHTADLVSFISATGTIEPEDLIDVGAQVAGRIVEFGRDETGNEIDYGSQVKAGMLLAHLDDSTYKSQLKMSRASVESAEANVARSQADLGQLKAKLDQARLDWERAQKLGPSDALARSSYDAYKFAYETALANVAVGEAAIKQAEAQVTQAKAQLDLANQNMGYTKIYSPVDGVIIDRRVNIGQTVVASLNAPSLFLLAKDLRQVQIWVAVNEADIGNIHAGQPVSFTIDAFPNEKFTGSVGKVRLNASMTQNVVTYTVEVVTENSSGRLLPYLTANVQFETGRADQALVVPNAALRWNPPGYEQAASRSADDAATTVATERRGGGEGSPAGAGGRRGQGGGRRRTGNGGQAGDPTLPVEMPSGSLRGNGSHPTRGNIWVQEGDQIRPIEVRVGISDGIDTQVSGRDLKEGMNVITGIRVVDQANRGPASPFMPQIRRGGRR